MKKQSRPIRRCLALVFLCWVSPLILTGGAIAQNQRRQDSRTREIVPLMENLKKADELNRDEAVDALVKLGSPAVSVLIEALQSDKLSVRQGAVEALKRIGQPAVPALIAALQSEAERVRWNAAATLGSIGYRDAEVVIPAIATVLKDPDARVRRRAAESLLQISWDWQLGRQVPSAAKNAVPDLRAALTDSEPTVRSKAALVLGNMRTYAADAIPDLRAALVDSEPSVRSKAALALGNMEAGAAAAIPDLRERIKDSEASVRGSAAIALGNIGESAASAVPDLRQALSDPDKDVRANAAKALGNVGAGAIEVLPDLRKVLEDPEVQVRNSAAQELRHIAINLQEKSKSLSQKELKQAIPDLEAILKIFESGREEFAEEDIATVRLSLQALKAQSNEGLVAWYERYKWVSAIVIYVIFFACLWSIIFWVRPLWMLPVNELLKLYEFKLPSLMGGAPVRPRELLLFKFFSFRHRVLDAWVAAHIESIREEFQKMQTVSDRSTYITVPVILDGNTLADLKDQDLRSLFGQERSCLLIWGEGGSGKTSIACQVALWAMDKDSSKRICPHLTIPVLIEEELNGKGANKQTLLEIIRRKLQDTSKKAEPISEELLGYLLKHRRIIVILDHISEMSEASRQQIQAESSDLNALVVTSRVKEKLSRTTTATIQPLRIAGNRLSSFIEAYLTQRGKRHLFDDLEFFTACIQLSQMVGEREIAIVLAKLYAEQMISVKEARTADHLPTTIPDLMLSYLNELNRDVAESSDRAVHQDAKALAWACLKPTYRPASAKIQDALDALSAVRAGDEEKRLQYLESKLRLIQTVGVDRGNIRFALDPVAEYLAALHLLDSYGKNDRKWLDFLDEAEAKNAIEAIKGFLLATRDCYLAKVEGAQETDFLPEQIGNLYGLTATAPTQGSQHVSP